MGQALNHLPADLCQSGAKHMGSCHRLLYCSQEGWAKSALSSTAGNLLSASALNYVSTHFSRQRLHLCKYIAFLPDCQSFLIVLKLLFQADRSHPGPRRMGVGAPALQGTMCVTVLGQAGPGGPPGRDALLAPLQLPESWFTI